MPDKEQQEARVYSAEDIQRLLNIGRSKVYDFLETVYRDQSPFRIIKVGRTYRIPKESFDKWLNGDG